MWVQGEMRVHGEVKVQGEMRVEVETRVGRGEGETVDQVAEIAYTNRGNQYLKNICC